MEQDGKHESGTSSLTQLKERNLARIVHALYRHRQLTLADLSQRVGLKRPTVSVLIGELLAASIAQENGTNQDTGGRHARSFGLATEAFRAIGVNIYRGGVQIAVTDLAGKVLKLHQKAIHPGEIDLAHVQQLIEETLQAPECDRPVLGIGVGTPGPIDLHDGSVLNPPNFPGMWGVALGSTLAQTFDLPVRIDDDARMRTVAEWMMGAGRESSNFVYVSVGSGIGSGIVIEGKLHYGVHGIAGQVGHITVDPTGPDCACGNVGCLEAVLLPMMAENDPDVQGIAQRLSQAVIAVGAIVDPELIIVGGDSGLVPKLIEGMEKYVASRAPFSRMQIRRGRLGENTAVLGAAMVAVRGFLDHPSAMLKRLSKDG